MLWSISVPEHSIPLSFKTLKKFEVPQQMSRAVLIG